MQPPYFFNGALGVVGQGGVRLQADEAVQTLLIDEHRGQNVGGVLNVGDGQCFVDGHIGVTGFGGGNIFVVFAAFGNCFLEDGRIGGNAAQTLVDQRLQLARVNKFPIQMIQPDRLAHFGGLFKFVFAVHHVSPLEM